MFTDLYQLTMAQAYWQAGKMAGGTFSLSFRSYPSDRGYFVFAGLTDALRYLEDLSFTDTDIDHLRSLGLFDDDFLTFLRGLRFTGSVRAMEEGAIFFANEPVMEVTAPVIESQIVETFLVNLISLQSLLATKASRVVHAARGRMVVDFAARRTHGGDAADKLARVSHMAGFSATSNVLAGARYGIPVSGTMAHSFVNTFEDEIESFRAYGRSFPDSSTFLVDTYDSEDGIKKAAQVALEMKRRGHGLKAIRLDSGNLLDLSTMARAMLDDAGLGEVQVFASGGLDEFEIDALVQAGAPIDGFGVGTKVGVSSDAPWADCVYKLVVYDQRPVLKLSPGKEILPGPKQVYRFRDNRESYLRDVIATDVEPNPGDGAEPLLTPVMNAGKTTVEPESLGALRKRFRREFTCLPERHKALRSPPPYKIEISRSLEELSTSVAGRVNRR
jgi:nicotinate phosphoribosyltransferase